MAKEMKFEEALSRLEEIVELLEAGEKPLDESLKLFEEGVKLARLCAKRLDAAEKKIEKLIQTASGELRTVPFGPEEPQDGELAGGGEDEAADESEKPEDDPQGRLL